MEAPSAPQPTLSQKLSLLWETRRGLFIAIVALISLIFFAAVFCIVYFLIIKPNQGSNEESKEAETAASHLLYQGLRNYAKLL